MPRLLPYSYVKKIEEMLNYSGSKRTPQSFVRNALAFSFVVGFVIGLASGQLLIVWRMVFLGMFLLFHGFLVLAVDRRTKFVENILPDALQLVAANIRAGFIPSRALVLSARKEFGPLSDGIKMAGKEMITGRSLQQSLTYITKKIKSEVLDTTIKLISRGVVSGGQLISLFDETAIDLRRKAAIKKEVRANIVVYGMFIIFAASVGAPALYSLSSFLVGTISKLRGSVQIPEDFAARTPLLKLGVTVSNEFLLIFSLLAILITSVFAGIIIGIINSGREKDGIKYIPMFLVVSLSVFFIAGIVIQSMFGSILPA